GERGERGVRGVGRGRPDVDAEHTAHVAGPGALEADPDDGDRVPVLVEDRVARGVNRGERLVEDGAGDLVALQVEGGRAVRVGHPRVLEGRVVEVDVEGPADVTAVVAHAQVVGAELRVDGHVVGEPRVGG